MVVGILWPSMMTMRRWASGLLGRSRVTNRLVHQGMCRRNTCLAVWPSFGNLLGGHLWTIFGRPSPRCRSAYVPEEMRSTIINFFRVPLNLFVCVVLYNVRRRAWLRLEGGGLYRRRQP